MGKRYRSPHLLDDGYTETREDGSKEEFYPDPDTGIIHGSRGTVLVPDRYGGYTRHDEKGSETFVRGLFDDNLYGSKGTVDTQNIFGDSISLVPDVPPPPLFPEASEPAPAPQPPRPAGEYRTTMQNSTRGMRFEAKKLQLSDEQRRAYLRYGASVLRQKLPPEGSISSTEYYTEEVGTGFLGLKKQQVQRSRTVKGESYWVLEHHEKTDEGGAWLESTEVTEQLLTLSGEVWEHKIVDHIHHNGRAERSYNNYSPKGKVLDYHLDELDLKFSRLGIPMTAARFFAPREAPAAPAKPAAPVKSAPPTQPAAVPAKSTPVRNSAPAPMRQSTPPKACPAPRPTTRERFSFRPEGVFQLSGRGCAVVGQVTGGSVRAGSSVTLRFANGPSLRAAVAEVEQYQKKPDSLKMGESGSLIFRELKKEQLQNLAAVEE